MMQRQAVDGWSDGDVVVVMDRVVAADVVLLVREGRTETSHRPELKQFMGCSCPLGTGTFPDPAASIPHPLPHAHSPTVAVAVAQAFLICSHTHPTPHFVTILAMPPWLVWTQELVVNLYCSIFMRAHTQALPVTCTHATVAASPPH
eukprot:151495-Chlamydomonas_euryale.AAC.4